MSIRPPAPAERLLAWALGPSADASAVLGDLNEDFAERVGTVGLARARRWYWREAVQLAVSSLAGRAAGRPIARSHDREGQMGFGEMWSTSALAHDARYAARAIRRDRGFFALATVIIGLGVGAATSVFSVMSPLLLRPLPFEEPGRLVLVERGTPTSGLSAVTSRTANLRDFRAQARSFEGVAGYNAFFDQLSYNLGGDSEPARLVGVNVTADFLDVLGIDPVLGRDFTTEEGQWGGFVDREGGPRSIVLTNGAWVRHFGADPSAIGRSYPLNDEAVTVIGVLPRHFDFSSVFTPTTPVDFLLPWPVSDATDSWGNTTTMVARLRPGVSTEAAQADLDAVTAGLEAAQPDRWGLDGSRVEPLQERLARPYRAALLLLAAAAGLVMLIVCVNLSNMLLARAPRRRREMAVRTTLGATRHRLVRQLQLESLGISAAGALLGVGLAFVVTRFVASRPGLDIPLLSATSIDPAALGFTAAIAVLAGLAVGAVPALSVSDGGQSAVLGGSARGSAGQRGGRRFREVLVVLEVAIACVLLVFGGLVLRSFQQVMDVDLGFEPEGVVAWQLRSARSFETEPERFAFYDRIVEEVAAVPGVQSVGMIDALPLGTNRSWSGRVEGEVYGENEFENFFPHVGDHRYLSTLGIPLIEGRGFTRDDGPDAPPVALVSETMARTAFPAGEALGRRLAIGFAEAEVVGVVGDVRHRALEIGADPEVYFPMAQLGAYNNVDLVVRSELRSATLAAAVAEAIRSVAPALPTEDFRTLESVVQRAVSPRRFTLQVLGAFGTAALLLAAVGIYGVLSYSVAERIPEIGIRMALGQSASDVQRGVVGRTMVLATVGVGLGIGASVAGARFVRSLLFGVEATDPATLAAMTALLLAVALLSCFLPARRASRTDSATALRSSA